MFACGCVWLRLFVHELVCLCMLACVGVRWCVLVCVGVCLCVFVCACVR